MLLLLSLALATNAMFAPDSRGYDARYNRTYNPSERDYKLAARAAEAKQITASEAADMAFYAAERVRQEKLAENTKIAADKLSEQQRRDRQQEDAAAAGKQARIAAVAEEWRKMYEDQDIERMRALNAGVFGAADAGRQRNADEHAALRAPVERQVEEARFMERRIQAEGKTLAELTESALAMGHRVQAATEAARWAPRFDRMEEEADQDELQNAYMKRHAGNKTAAVARNAENARVAAAAEAARAAKQAIRNARQKQGKSMYKRFGETAEQREALNNKFGLSAEEREAKRDATLANMTRSFDALSDDVEIENNKPALRKIAERVASLFPRHVFGGRANEPAFPTEFQPEFKHEAY